MRKGLLLFSRIFVGVLFIFSGLIKANDPVGFAIKLEEYYEIFASGGGLLSVFELPFIIHSVVFQAAFICVLEVALGVLLLLGMWPRLVTWLLLLMIIFFTILTGYSAVTGKVTDCGCFGDAIPLTPWQSFYKDLILIVFIGILFIGRKHIKRLMPVVPSYVLFLAGTVFTIWVANTAVRYDVFIDFRPYKVGNNISELMAIPPDAAPAVVEMQYVYRNKNNGEEAVVGIRTDENNYDLLTPYSDTEVWEFSERRDKVIDPGFVPKIADFAVIDAMENDITEQVLSFGDYMFMIVSPGLDHTHKEAWAATNELQQAAEKEGVFTFGLVASSRPEIDAFRHAHQAAFPFYQGDHKVCLAIARTNPAIVLMKQGTVIAKWPWREVPDYQSVKEEYFPQREHTPVLFMANEDAGLFQVGDAAGYKLQNSIEPYNEFFLMDKDGNDQAPVLLSDSGRVHLISINRLLELTNEQYLTIEPILKALKESGANYFLMSSSNPTVMAEMSQVTGLGFAHYETDGEVLSNLFSHNLGYLILENGVVRERIEGTDWPMPSEE